MTTSADHTSRNPGRDGRGWVREPEHRGGLSRYIQVTRDHWRLMLILLGLVVGAALLAVTVSSKDYEAEALLSVSPVSSSDTRFDGISVIRETSVPGRDVETLARLVKTIPVARAAAATEGVGGNPNALLSRVEVSPIGGSFLVSITAVAPSGEAAAALANAFAQGTVTVRSAQFREQVESELEAVNAQLASSEVLPESTRVQLNERLSQLQALRGLNDPSIQLETAASVPDDPTTPPLLIIIAIALVVGGIVAFGGAVAVDTASSRIRTEGQLSERFNLPVLARIPRAAAGPEAVADAHRDLAQSIAVARRDPERPRSLLFTSPGEDEGCTATAIEAARTLADAGQRVLLVDVDLRKPAIARTMGLNPAHGTGSVLLGGVSLDRAAENVPGFRGGLAVVGGDDPESAAAVVSMSPAMVRRLVDAATGHADFVIFDGAPLGTVADAAPVATAADDVIVVVRRGETELAQLNRLTETLVRYGVQPSGLCLVDWSHHTAAGGGGGRRGGADEGRSREDGRRERGGGTGAGRGPRRDERGQQRRRTTSEAALAGEAGAVRRREEGAVAEAPAPEVTPTTPPGESLAEFRRRLEQESRGSRREEPPAAPVASARSAAPVAASEPAAREPEPVVRAEVPAEPVPVVRAEEPVAEQPEPVVVAEPRPAAEEPVVVAEPEPVVADEPEAVAEEPEPEPVVAEEPEAEEPAAEEPVVIEEPVVVAEPEPVVADEPEAVAEEPEPEPVVAEEPEPEPEVEPEAEQPAVEEPVVQEPEAVAETAEVPDAVAEPAAGEEAAESADDPPVTAPAGVKRPAPPRPRKRHRPARPGGRPQ